MLPSTFVTYQVGLYEARLYAIRFVCIVQGMSVWYEARLFGTEHVSGVSSTFFGTRHDYALLEWIYVVPAHA